MIVALAYDASTWEKVLIYVFVVLGSANILDYTLQIRRKEVAEHEEP